MNESLKSQNEQQKLEMDSLKDENGALTQSLKGHKSQLEETKQVKPSSYFFLY